MTIFVVTIFRSMIITTLVSLHDLSDIWSNVDEEGSRNNRKMGFHDDELMMMMISSD